jgi:hypothetical protein
MTRMKRLAVFLLLSWAIIGCGKRLASRPMGKPIAHSGEEEWRPYDDLPFGSPARRVTAEAFDQVRSGMTLAELVRLLGRGWMCEQYEGCGIIRWACQDGRELSVWPITYRRDEVILVNGGSGGVGRLWMTDKDGMRAMEIPKKKAT